MAPTLKGLRWGALNGNAWKPTSAYAQLKDRVTLSYVSNTLPAGYTDKVYVSGQKLTATNYADIGAVAATISNSAATSVTLTGLEQDTTYYALCVRFDEVGNPTSPLVTSDLDIVRTASNEISVTPANLDITADWSAESIFSWFRLFDRAYLLDYSANADGVMGDFVRISSNVAGKSSFYTILDGLKKVSPRYDWTLEIPVRMPAAGTSFQHFFGFNSGAENLVALETRRHHGVYTSPDSGNWLNSFESPVGTDTNGGNGSDDEAVQLIATAYDNTNATTSSNPHTVWRATPTAAHPDYAKWKAPRNERVVFRFEYSATTKEVKVYIGTDLVTTLGATHGPTVLRKKFPEGNYPLPIVPTFRGQQITTLNGFYVDLGAIRMTSACPYDYAGWAAESGHHGSYNLYASDGVDYYDPASHTLNELSYFVGIDDSSTFVPDSEDPEIDVIGANRRMLTRYWPGYTVPSDIALVHSDHTPVYSLDVATKKTQFVPVPSGKMPLAVAFQGLKQHGTIEARLLDQDDQPLTAWFDVDGVYDSQLRTISGASATKVRAEVRLQYDGTPLTSDWEVTTPTPPLFAGFEVYMGTPPPPSADPPTGRYQTAQAVTLTGTGTIYYTLDGSDPAVSGTRTLYTGALIVVPFSETPVTLKFVDDTAVVQSATYEFYLEGSLAAPPVSLQPAVAAPSLEGVSIGGVASATVTLHPSVSASALTGVQVGTILAPGITLRPSVAAPSITGVVEGVSIGSVSAPFTTVQILVNPPSLVGVAAGTAIRAPSGELWDLRDIYGAPLDIRAVA